MVVVDPSDEAVTFRATTTANVIRAAVPPGRAADVFVLIPQFEGGVEGGAPSPERARLTDVTARETRAAVARAGGQAIVAELGAYLPADERGSVGPTEEVAPDVWLAGTAPTPAAEAEDPLRPSSPAAIVGASIAVLALLWLVGYGWARTVTDATAAAALAPAFGLAAMIVAAIALERAGVPLDGSVGPTAVSVLAGGGGYVCRLVLGAQREAPAEPPTEVEE